MFSTTDGKYKLQQKANQFRNGTRQEFLISRLNKWKNFHKSLTSPTVWKEFPNPFRLQLFYEVNNNNNQEELCLLLLIMKKRMQCIGLCQKLFFRKTANQHIHFFKETQSNWKPIISSTSDFKIIYSLYEAMMEPRTLL